MNKTFTAEQMLAYLQSELDDFMEAEEKFGVDNEMVHFKMEMMIGAKEMVETLICMPVNLQKDGKVTVGF